MDGGPRTLPASPPAAARAPVRTVARAVGRAVGREALPVVALLVFAVFHFVLRYAMRFSDDATAVGYRDAPTWFKVLKDLALAACVVALVGLVVVGRAVPAWRARARALPPVAWWLAVVAGAGAFVAALVNAAADRASTQDALLFTFRYPFVPIAGLVLWVLAVDRDRTVAAVRLLFAVVTAGSLGFWLFTVVANAAVGRRPALSQPGLLRFGGPLDDPNGFGVLLVAMYLWLESERVRAARIPVRRAVAAVQVLVVVAVVWTRSLSAAMCFAVAVALAEALPLLHGGPGGLVGRIRRMGRATVVHAVACVAVVGAAAYTFATSDLKQDGFASRVDQADLSGTSLTDLLVGRPRGVVENFFLYLWQSAGAVLTVLFVALVAVVVLRAARVAWSGGPLAWVFSWMVGVLVAANFIPYLQVYPVSLWFWALGGAAVVVSAPRQPVEVPAP